MREDLLKKYDYILPAERIAMYPPLRRIQSKLLVLEKGRDFIHQKVADLVRWLHVDDLLVLNNTKVLSAKLLAKKLTGGKVEILLLDPIHPLVKKKGEEFHRVVLKSGRSLFVGSELLLEDETSRVILKIVSLNKKKAIIKIPCSALNLMKRWGQLPLPPYIKRGKDDSVKNDLIRYQTIYAKKEGAVAAPTAGLHFSIELLKALEKRGIRRTFITLHVGYGTFARPNLDDLRKKRLYPEWVEVSQETVRKVMEAKLRGGRVIAVGTTSVRALEWSASSEGNLQARKGWCDLLIEEGYKFKIVEGLFTNFHLPRTTLLMLVSALAGRNRILNAYNVAIQNNYNFYSYGDAMLVV